MHVMILGAAGMIGSRLATALALRATRMTLVDRVEPTLPAGSEGTPIAADLGAPGEAARLAAMRPDLVYHLAAVVSAEAEADFEKGYAVNLAAIQALLEAIRLEGNAPRFVFSSSLAVYGPPFPDPVPEDFGLRPQSSYGTQKAIGELLVADYARKGFIEGITLRLPTIVIRPGAANAAASGFLSGILREPLAGLPAELPVAEEARVWIASPRVAVESLAHAATLPHEVLAETPVLNLNGLSVSIGEMLDSLERAAGAEARARVSRVDRPEIARIVQSWPPAFVTERARALGFPADTSIDDIITDHLCATG